ncbi:MAG TPA: class I SAM-dependent methyltransferase [Bacteroidales bacterium]|nr:class I SAM-dependent methyltransferase [Bacteroidales bacterium]HRW85335.1 class I SAM-dependent methyltransferase [Bacteroidales bacterium]
MPKTEPFDNHFFEYGQWFIDNHNIFQSELEALRRVVPLNGRGIEIGIGNGIFAVPLGIGEGVEPSRTMREAAIKKGLKVTNAVAEDLPFPDADYDFALMITTICFVDDINLSFTEANRILKADGLFILGFVDKESPVGEMYLRNKEKSLFYRDASFYSTSEVKELLIHHGFVVTDTLQTVFGLLPEIREIQKPENGSGRGSFIVIKAKKLREDSQ